MNFLYEMFIFNVGDNIPDIRTEDNLDNMMESLGFSYTQFHPTTNVPGAILADNFSYTDKRGNKISLNWTPIPDSISVKVYDYVGREIKLFDEPTNFNEAQKRVFNAARFIRSYTQN